jgi:RNA polymerase sigma-70 factor (ECF subfamily)
MTTARQARHQEVIDVFLGAARRSNLVRLLGVPEPEVVLRQDPAVARAATSTGWPDAGSEVSGVDVVARAVAGRDDFARAPDVDGVPGLVWAPGGRPRAVFRFPVAAGAIAAIDIAADPATVSAAESAVGPESASLGGADASDRQSYVDSTVRQTSKTAQRMFPASRR